MRILGTLVVAACIAVLAGCGSGNGTEQVSQAASSVTVPTGSTKTVTKTTTQPAVTQHVETTSVTNSTSINVQPTTTTPSAATNSEAGGLPGWAWVLVGLGIVAVATAAIVSRHHSKRRAGAGPPDEPATGG
jgi:hypothetical protein